MAFHFGPRIFNNPLVLEPYMWHRADSVTKDVNDFVESFTDLAGSGNYLRQTSPTNQPQYIQSLSVLNNQPAIKFDGINDSMTTISNLNMQTLDRFSFYIVISRVTATVDGFNLGGTGNGQRFFWTSGALRFRVRRGDNTLMTYSPAGTTGRIIRIQYTGFNNDGVNDIIGVRTNNSNEVLTTVTNGGLFTYSGTFSFGAADVQSVWYDGYLSELLVFKRHLSYNEDVLLMEYLNDRYRQY